MQVFREVREPHTNKLLFRYDPERELIEIVDRCMPFVVDLTRYREPTDKALDNQDGSVVISPV